MRQAATILTFDTARQGLVDITAPIVGWVADQGFETGLLTVFCRHTSASLLIQENAAREGGPISKPISRGSRPSRPTMHMTTRVPTTCPRTCAPR
jgi:thiamine phosphate synthase YjbQ (UPF0047 family)